MLHIVFSVWKAILLFPSISLNIHNPFRVLVNKLMNIDTDVIASDDNIVQLAVHIRTKIGSSLDHKKLGEMPLKRKN